MRRRHRDGVDVGQANGVAHSAGQSPAEVEAHWAKAMPRAHAAAAAAERLAPQLVGLTTAQAS